MAKTIGRNFLIRKNSVAIASVRTKSFSWGGEAVDVTTDDQDGVRALLSDFGQEQLDISCEGLSDTQTLRDIALTIATTKMLTDITLLFDNGDSISGNFLLTSYEESGTYNDAVTFSASLQSSGSWTYTTV